MAARVGKADPTVAFDDALEEAMMNALPTLALALVALGYAGAIASTNAAIDATEQSALRQNSANVAAFPATTGLAVQDFAARNGQIDAPLCDSHQVITQTLSHDFEESMREHWVQAADMKLELWASDMFGTWTVLHLGTDGMTCVVSSGTGWNGQQDVAQVIATSDLQS